MTIFSYWGTCVDTMDAVIFQYIFPLVLNMCLQHGNNSCLQILVESSTSLHNLIIHMDINYGVSLSKHILSNNNSTLLHWKYYKAERSTQKCLNQQTISLSSKCHCTTPKYSLSIFLFFVPRLKRNTTKLTEYD